MNYELWVRRGLLLVAALFVVVGATAQELVPVDRTPVYRRSFMARYELIGGGPVREAALSPDGSRVGFVRDNDLYVKDLASGHETRITHDGERNKIINGATDWVYEEEYSFTRAWEWSPDGEQIAFLRFDESRVPEFTMMRYDGRLYPEPYTFKYPKAGEDNSVVTLNVFDIEKQSTRQVDHKAGGYRPANRPIHSTTGVDTLRRTVLLSCQPTAKHLRSGVGRRCGTDCKTSSKWCWATVRWSTANDPAHTSNDPTTKP